MFTFTLPRGFWRYIVGAVALALVSAMPFFGWPFSDRMGLPGDGKPAGEQIATDENRPPWTYGRKSDSRFVITIYADLECPYCKAYVPALKSWIDRNPQVALRWHHLPLPFHEPAATRLAVIAECMGRIEGQTAFWDTVEWIFRHTRGDGQGLPSELKVPGVTPAVTTCLNSEGPKEAVREQARIAARDGIDATPTIKLQASTGSQHLVLPGAVEGDALLSALDLLSSETEAGQTSANGPPAGAMGLSK